MDPMDTDAITKDTKHTNYGGIAEIGKAGKRKWMGREWRYFGG